MVRLIKFRSLGNADDFEKAKDIIKSEKFWCSKLWNLNDPMEGVFSTYHINLIPDISNQKKNYVICSFSELEALKNPLLWGYYANGFKGIAIEIEVDESTMQGTEEIKKIDYNNERLLASGINDIKTIITTKKKDWCHEKEVRFLKKSKTEGLYKIGEIKKIYFGSPYKNISNYQEIRDDSRTLRQYNYYKDELKLVCKKHKNGRISDDFIVDYPL